MKLFTKSAFKIALECPWKLYYYNNPDAFDNANTTDEFLQSLAEGGFQVGELAKIYQGVDDDADLKDLKGYEAPLKETQRLMQRTNVYMAEAAFRFGNLFVRADILKKEGDKITIIEVKAKSWDSPDEDAFIRTKKKDNSVSVRSEILPYLYDVAFQKYVIANALKNDYPDKTFKVEARLMMADKRFAADIDGLNQMFKIVKNAQGNTEVEIAPDAKQKLAQSSQHILTPFDVNRVCDLIIEGETTEQPSIMNGRKFVPFIEEVSNFYNKNMPYPNKPVLNAKCFGCEFRSDDKSKDGHRRCWLHYVSGNDLDNRPMIDNLWGQYIKRGEWIKEGIFFFDQIPSCQNLLKPETGITHDGLDHCQRKWLQIGMQLDNKAILDRFTPWVSGHTYLDKDGLRSEMSRWKYPLHMIDFETTAVALPYYKGMKPYQQVAFQFSHHIINEDGTVVHAGQYLNEDVTEFPNFEFLRHLKGQLQNDQGTIFRYATHENSILLCIAQQLEDSNEPDKDELIAFVKSITHNTNEKYGESYKGDRDMVDLLEVVKRYFYYLDEMHGSNSIKQVLPAVLNASQYLKDKYSKPIYGKEIPSKNIPADAPIAWVRLEENYHVDSPYHQLPHVGELIGLNEEESKMLETLESTDNEMQVANGGAALTAYNKLMFCKDEAQGSLREGALRQALLRYCELDTMSMVFIYEYFKHEADT